MVRLTLQSLIWLTEDTKSFDIFIVKRIAEILVCNPFLS